jgi:biopolymer transport protein TolR
MGIAVGGSKRGTFVEINVVPLIDVLLVLLVIFMIIQHPQMGLRADIPQAAETPSSAPQPEVIVVQVSADGSLKVNSRSRGKPCTASLSRYSGLARTMWLLFAAKNLSSFKRWARVIDIMHTAGITTVGLMTPTLEKSR